MASMTPANGDHRETGEPRPATERKSAAAPPVAAASRQGAATGPAPSGDTAGRDRPATDRREVAESPRSGRHGSGRTRNLYWLLPTFAFLLGVVLGGGVIAAANLDSGDEPVAAATPTPDAGSDAGDRTVTVPASCADGLDRADAAVQAARNGISAIGNLDTAALQRALDRLQTLQPQISDLAGKCRAAATE